MVSAHRLARAVLMVMTESASVAEAPGRAARPPPARGGGAAEPVVGVPAARTGPLSYAGTAPLS